MASFKVGILLAALAALVAAMPPEKPDPAAIREEDLVQEESQVFTQSQKFVDSAQPIQQFSSQDRIPNQDQLNYPLSSDSTTDQSQIFDIQQGPTQFEQHQENLDQRHLQDQRFQGQDQRFQQGQDQRFQQVQDQRFQQGQDQRFQQGQDQRFQGQDQRFQQGQDQRFQGQDQRFQQGQDQRFQGQDQRFQGQDQRFQQGQGQRFQQEQDQRFQQEQSQFQGQNYRNNVNQEFSQNQRQQHNQVQDGQYQGQTVEQTQQNLGSESFSSDSLQNQRSQDQDHLARIPGAVETPINQEFQRSRPASGSNQRYESGQGEPEPVDPTLGNYQYSYDIRSEDTGDMKYHKESRDGNTVTGEYRVKEADGTIRIVKYTADALNGFQATVEYIREDEVPVEFGARMKPKTSRPSTQRNLGNRQVFEPARERQETTFTDRAQSAKKDDMSLFVKPESKKESLRSSGFANSNRFDSAFQEDSTQFQEQEYNRDQLSNIEPTGQLQNQGRPGFQNQVRPLVFQERENDQYQRRNQFQRQDEQFQGRNDFQNQERNQFHYNNRAQDQGINQYQNQQADEFQNENENQFQSRRRNPLLFRDRSRFQPQEINENQDQDIAYFQNEREQNFQNPIQDNKQFGMRNQERRPSQILESNRFQQQDRTNFRAGGERDALKSKISGEQNIQFQQRQRGQIDLDDEHNQFQNTFVSQRNQQFNNQRQTQLRQNPRIQSPNQFNDQIQYQQINQQIGGYQTSRNRFQNFNTNQFSSQRGNSFPEQRDNRFSNQRRNEALTFQQQVYGPNFRRQRVQNRFQSENEHINNRGVQQSLLQDQSNDQRYAINSQNLQFKGEGVYTKMEDTRYQSQRYGQSSNQFSQDSSNLNQAIENPTKSQIEFSNNQQTNKRDEQFKGSSNIQVQNNDFQDQNAQAVPYDTQSNANFQENSPSQGPQRVQQFGIQGQRTHQRFETVADPHPQPQESN